MSKLITVFGATGNQGGSVIKHLLADPVLSKEFKIRGITRDISKPAAKALADQGVETVSADLNSPSSVLEAVKGSHTVFLVTNYWETAKPEVELTQGHNVTTACAEAKVSHLIFSSLINVTEATNGRLPNVPHFDGKAKIEQEIKASSIPRSTFILPGYFMLNYLKMLRKGPDGVWTLAYPVDSGAKFPLFDPADTGLFVLPALKSNLPSGTQILAATAYYTPTQILSDFEAVVPGAQGKTRFAQITAEQYKGFLPPPVAQEFLENHLLIQEPGYYAGAALEPSLELVAGAGQGRPTTFKEFLEKSVGDGEFK